MLSAERLSLTSLNTAPRVLSRNGLPESGKQLFPNGRILNQIQKERFERSTSAFSDGKPRIRSAIRIYQSQRRCWYWCWCRCRCRCRWKPRWVCPHDDNVIINVDDIFDGNRRRWRRRIDLRIPRRARLRHDRGTNEGKLITALQKNIFWWGTKIPST